MATQPKTKPQRCWVISTRRPETWHRLTETLRGLRAVRPGVPGWRLVDDALQRDLAVRRARAVAQANRQPKSGPSRAFPVMVDLFARPRKTARSECPAKGS